MKISRRQKLRGKRIVGFFFIVILLCFLLGGLRFKFQKTKPQPLANLPQIEPPEEIEKIFSRVKGRIGKEEGKIQLPSGSNLRKKAEEQIVRKTKETLRKKTVEILKDWTEKLSKDKEVKEEVCHQVCEDVCRNICQ